MEKEGRTVGPIIRPGSLSLLRTPSSSSPSNPLSMRRLENGITSPLVFPHTNDTSSTVTTSDKRLSLQPENANSRSPTPTLPHIDGSEQFPEVPAVLPLLIKDIEILPPVLIGVVGVSQLSPTSLSSTPVDNDVIFISQPTDSPKSLSLLNPSGAPPPNTIGVVSSQGPIHSGLNSSKSSPLDLKVASPLASIFDSSLSQSISSTQNGVPCELSMEVDDSSNNDLQSVGPVTQENIVISDADFANQRIEVLSTTVWHSSLGFCINWPSELEAVRRELQRSKLTGALHREVALGRYIFWSWNTDWYICAGYYSTFEDNNDLELLLLVNNMCNTSVSSDWNEPACVMDLVLGDTLMKGARIKFKGIAESPSSPAFSSPARSWGSNKPCPLSETMYATADVILKMDIEYPPLMNTNATERDRMKYLRENCALKIHLKEFLFADASSDLPSIIFGPSSQGYHTPLFRANTVSIHKHDELQAFAAKSNIIIGIKEKSDRRHMARFDVSSKAFSHLLEAFETRILEISGTTTFWTPRPLVSIHTNRPTLPCDREMLSSWVLIGNIDPNIGKDPTTLAALPGWIRTVVEDGSRGDFSVDEDDLTTAFQATPSFIRPSNLGIEDHLCIRSLKVIKLSCPARVGVTLGGGSRLIRRVLANGKDAPFPIYLTKQFLSDEEASLLLASETTNIDACVMMARRLTKKTELDDLVRRAFKAAVESVLKCEVHVWLATARHQWNGPKSTEESFLIAAVSAREGGRTLGNTFPGFENSASFCKLAIGSLELECFRDLKAFINKPWKNSFQLTQVAEIGHVEPGLVMGDILRELVGYNSHNILGVVKCDPWSHTDRWDKWMLLVSSDGKDWDKDPRPPNWNKMGWTLSVKRPGSPIVNVSDSKKYVTLRWDSEGHSISKETIRLHPNLSAQTESESSSSTPSSGNVTKPKTNDGFKQVKSRKNQRNSLHANSSGTSIPMGKGHTPLPTTTASQATAHKKGPQVTIMTRQPSPTAIPHMGTSLPLNTSSDVGSVLPLVVAPTEEPDLRKTSITGLDLPIGGDARVYSMLSLPKMPSLNVVAPLAAASSPSKTWVPAISRNNEARKKIPRDFSKHSTTSTVEEVRKRLKLDTLPPEEKDCAIGDALFPLIANLDEFPQRIAGMIMEYSEVELLNLLADPKLLKTKVLEARGIINRHSFSNSITSWGGHDPDDPTQRESGEVNMGDRTNDQKRS